MTTITKRLSVWAIIIAVLLLIPLVLTLLGSGVDGDGWHWTAGDFVFASVLLFGSAFVYEFATRNTNSTKLRVAVGVVVAAVLGFVWVVAATQ